MIIANFSQHSRDAAQSESDRKFDDRKRNPLPRNFMPKKCSYTLRIVQARFESVVNVLFSLFSRLHTRPFANVPVVEFRFQNLLLHICLKNYAIFVCLYAHFVPFSNLLVSCERSLLGCEIFLKNRSGCVLSETLNLLCSEIAFALDRDSI